MTIKPEGEALRQATKWISNERLANPSLASRKLIEQACLKFDLSPNDAEFLTRYLLESSANAPSSDPS
jgi:hypothetical protein